jgi:hypothetical protein
MNSKRVYFLTLGLLGILIIGLIGGAYGVNSLLQAQSQKLVKLKSQSQVLVGQQTGLTKAKKQVQQYASLEKIAKTVVPQDKDQAEAVREIAKLATDSGIGQLSSVTFPASTLGGLPGASTTTPAPASAGSKLTQLVPVVGINGVYQLQITITQASESRVPYSQFITFLGKLEQNRRTAQVSSISLQPDTKDPNMVAFTLIINEFIKP